MYYAIISYVCSENFYSLEYITETERKRLLDMCGHVREIFDMSKGVLQDLVNISERAKMSIYYRRDCGLIQKEMEMMQKKNGQMTVLFRYTFLYNLCYI